MVNSQLNSATSTTQLAAVAMAAEQPTVVQIQSTADLITKEARVNGLDPVLANKIAYCESTMRQFDKDGQVLRGIKNPKDVGLFQINEDYHIVDSQDKGYDIHTTEGNIDYAMWLLKNEGTRHWKSSQKCWGGA